MACQGYGAAILFTLSFLTVLHYIIFSSSIKFGVINIQTHNECFSICKKEGVSKSVFYNLFEEGPLSFDGNILFVLYLSFPFFWFWNGQSQDTSFIFNMNIFLFFHICFHHVCCMASIEFFL